MSLRGTSSTLTRTKSIAASPRHSKHAWPPPYVRKHEGVEAQHAANDVRQACWAAAAYAGLCFTHEACVLGKQFITFCLLLL